MITYQHGAAEGNGFVKDARILEQKLLERRVAQRFSGYDNDRSLEEVAGEEEQRRSDHQPLIAHRKNHGQNP